MIFDHALIKTTVHFDHIAKGDPMKRLIDHQLLTWKNAPFRKPLILRGARQVGKTFSVRKLGATFENFVEINFEANIEAKNSFEGNLDPETMLRSLAFITGKPITPGKTLLFFDEIQNAPRALLALRYFYEQLPELHVLAAGSLLDFTIQAVGIPVGRVTSLYVYPLSFFEFLCARGYTIAAREIIEHDIHEPLSEPIHKKLLTLLGEYIAIGGMPEAVSRWHTTQDPVLCFEVHQGLIDTYRQDFGKYATKYQIKYLEALFTTVPRHMSKKCKYSFVEGDYRKRELAPSLDLLVTAGVMHQITSTAANGLPLGAEADLSDFKILLLDIALAQSILGFNLKDWFLHPEQTLINKGDVVEAFIGQELLAYAHPKQKAHLYYWRRNTRGSEAEVDYLIQQEATLLPVEVKSGSGSTLKSMHMFLESHPQSPYGLRFSTQNYSIHNNIHSYPLYALLHVVGKERKEDILNCL